MFSIGLGEDIGSSPANRLIVVRPKGKTVRQALLDAIKAKDTTTLTSHGIGSDAMEALVRSDPSAFIPTREAELGRVEQSFISNLGLELDRSAPRDESEIDTE